MMYPTMQCTQLDIKYIIWWKKINMSCDILATHWTNKNIVIGLIMANNININSGIKKKYIYELLYKYYIKYIWKRP